ncbi:GNAT family N-acetyltransferase [Actinokineospora bangkokensis]|uniref:GNAT family N-acetyltransferase n=1 Tax=Actinokineospora bangkokensis TaxID=1193682 RepID=A0A1Q9LKE1_9PSEU|nr:GNAT family N-acetyltransferase [Actinokineospora bangkokensis]OLR92490.1 GNAT family N-acetyltransferase [Actinokineospora bangkokensis]
MTPRVVVDDLSGAAIAEFLGAHLAQMRATSPPESKHALDLDGLRAPGVTFWSVLDDDGSVLGCGALKLLTPEHAELKSMRTDPARRRTGIASLLLTHILTEATALGCTRISLETGSAEFFRPARTLYTRFGFTPCPPFGDYRPDPHSAFFTRQLP